MPSYNLYLSSDKPYRAVYTNEEGMVIYKTETHKLGNTTKISRAVRPIDADNQADETAFAHLAEVEYHTFRTSRIRYSKLPGGGQGEDGKGTPVEEVFRKSGWVGVYGRDRIFTGPDGNEYKWVLGGDECEVSREMSNFIAEVLLNVTLTCTAHCGGRKEDANSVFSW